DVHCAHFCSSRVDDELCVVSRDIVFRADFFFFQAEDGIRDFHVTGVQTCALPILARQRCLYVVCLFFWRNQRLICVIAIMRTAMQGDFLPAEMKLLRELYPQFLTALHRLGTLEREHSVRMDLCELLKRLPLPTIL